MNLLLSLLKGFGASGSLIVAIGAQNAFVIRQGLRLQHLLLTALLCSLIDGTLIILGVMGFGNFISSYPLFIDLTKYFAIIFLFIYGALAFKSAFKKKTALSLDEQVSMTAKKTIISILAFSLLNPHVYLDTVILLGSIASQQPAEEQLYFAFGAIAASFAWFFAITYGARLLAPFLQKEKSWRIIDCCIAATMWGIAITLISVM